MGRKHIEIKKINKLSNRKLTYYKRFQGLAKKAYELSVLCDIDIALISFSPSGKLMEFSNQQWTKTVLQRFCRTVVPNISEEQRAKLQISQNIINLINAMAGEDDANDQKGTDASEEKKTMREITLHEFKLSSLQEKMKMFFPGTFNSVQEWERHQKFLEYTLAEVVRRRQQIMSQSQLGIFIPRTNPSLSTQQQIESGMQSAHWHIPMLQQQKVTEAGMWDPLQGGEQAPMGYPSSSSSSARTSVPSLVESEVTAPYGTSKYEWGSLVGYGMPSSGLEERPVK